MKGYKVFEPDWTCRGFQYEVGKEYRHEGEIGLCKSGFHFCKKLVDCFNYYDFNPRNKVAEIEAFGEFKSEGYKSVTNGIKIIKELSWYEVLDMVNTGDYNSGIRNSGDCNSGNTNSGNTNSGDCNSGDCNSGDCNSGNTNSGDWNSGIRNSGGYNSGDCNSGNRNSGGYNSGDCNSGNWNSTDYSSGYFNTIRQPLIIFNKPTNVSRGIIYGNFSICAMRRCFKLNKWITEEAMTDEEKERYPDYETTGGYLKSYEYKEACANMWAKMTEKERDGVWDIPNFDPEIFFEITGIKVEPREEK